jgi:hypothetical protein
VLDTRFGPCDTRRVSRPRIFRPSSARKLRPPECRRSINNMRTTRGKSRNSLQRQANRLKRIELQSAYVVDTRQYGNSTTALIPDMAKYYEVSDVLDPNRVIPITVDKSLSERQGLKDKRSNIFDSRPVGRLLKRGNPFKMPDDISRVTSKSKRKIWEPT